MSDPVPASKDRKRYPKFIYVFAQHTGSAPFVSEQTVLIVFTRTPKGWVSRSTLRDHFHHEYSSHESFENVIEWLHLETKRHYITTDRAEALAVLKAPYESSAAHRLRDSEWDATMPVDMQMDRVLQRLELY